MHPLTKIVIFLCLSVSTLLSRSIELVIFHGILTVLLIVFFRVHWSEWVLKLRPFWIYFPIAGVFFLCISLMVSNKDVSLIIQDVSIATCRMILLVSIMTLYSILSKSSDIIISIRGLWYRMNKSWKWVEDLILFTDITFRFYPSLQDQWQRLERTRKALVLSKSANKFIRAQNFAAMVPDFVILNLERANDLTTVMKLRGYGQAYPRSVYPIISSTWIDKFAIVLVIVGLVGLHSFDKI